MNLTRGLLFFIALGWSCLSHSVPQNWVSNNPSMSCKVLVTKYFKEFAVTRDNIVLSLEKLKLYDKKGWFDRLEFYTFQSNLSGSTRTLTLIKSTDEQSWVASIPDQLLGCRMLVQAISEKEKVAILEGTASSLAVPKTVAATEAQAGDQKESLQTNNVKELEAGDVESNSYSEATKDLTQELDRLRAQLAQLKTERQVLKTKIDVDEIPPLLEISKVSSSGGQGLIEGLVKDNVGIAEVRLQGKVIRINDDGQFSATVYVPEGGANITIVATDFSGLQSRSELFIERADIAQSEITFENLDPLTLRAEANPDAIALIVGISKYENVAKADFADSDAAVFTDYAKAKLGVSDDRVIFLSDEEADITGMLLSVQDRLNRSVRKDKSDVYIFFAGHGLASDDGEQAYLIPYDGSPRLLARTAISRDELFEEVSRAGPRSVTVFLDTCYSGDTRGGAERLIAARSLGIMVREQIVPEGFTVFTAAAGDQTAKPLEEAQHGMFSYFLMKGMEGGADTNSDNQITARELHSYVRENVVQQSGGSQVPELQGDGERVLVRFR